MLEKIFLFLMFSQPNQYFGILSFHFSNWIAALDHELEPGYNILVGNVQESILSDDMYKHLDGQGLIRHSQPGFVREICLANLSS